MAVARAEEAAHTEEASRETSEQKSNAGLKTKHRSAAKAESMKTWHENGGWRG